MKNEHEQLVGQFLAYASGGACLFFPPDVPKGGGKREPCDLFWATDEVVVAVFCSEKTFSESPERNTTKTRKSIDHNLRQAKGWIRDWERHGTLSAKNAFGTIKLPFGRDRELIVLSVVDGGSLVFESHTDFAQSIGAKLAVSLSKHHLNLMCQNRFSLFDILAVLANPSSPTDIEEPGIALGRQIASYAISAQAQTAFLIDFPSGFASSDFPASQHYFLSALAPTIRESLPERAFYGDRSNLGTFAVMLASTPLVDFLHRCVAIHQMQQAWLHARRVESCIVHGTYHDFFLIGTLGLVLNYGPPFAIEQLFWAIDAGFAKPGLSLTAFLDAGGAILSTIGVPASRPISDLLSRI